MKYLESQLATVQQDSSGTRLVIYKTGSHQGYRTYDGVDINGKRVADEILEQSARVNPARFSIVGYSLGGLIARYALGVLHSQGYFDDIEPINFVSFCTPHVGIMSPLRNNLLIRVFNQLAPYLLAHSGSQMFMTDKKPGKRPLLVWMAHPRSLFYQALAKFRYRSLYANAVNDKRTCWFTSYISESDPFNTITNSRPEIIAAHSIPGYAPCLLDMNRSVAIDQMQRPAITSSERHPALARLVSWLTVLVNVCIYTPPLVLFFLVNSLIQRVRANKRVRQFLLDTSNICTTKPRSNSEHDEANSIQSIFDLLHQDMCDQVSIQQDTLFESVYDAIGSCDDAHDSVNLLSPQPSYGAAPTETLDLDSDQRFIVKNLNALGWEKHGVLISGTRTTHAAIIVRHHDPSFEEGKVVVRHFVEQCFKTD